MKEQKNKHKHKRDHPRKIFFVTFLGLSLTWKLMFNLFFCNFIGQETCDNILTYWSPGNNLYKLQQNQQQQQQQQQQHLPINFQLVRTCTTCRGVVNVVELILSLCLESIKILSRSRLSWSNRACTVLTSDKVHIMLLLCFTLCTSWKNARCTRFGGWIRSVKALYKSHLTSRKWAGSFTFTFD